MIYDNIQDNLVYFIDSFGLLTFEQIKKMFSFVSDDTLTWQLNDLALAGKIDKPSSSQTVKSKAPLGFSPAIQANLTQSAWIIANVGADKIESIIPIGAPVSCEFITTDGNIYDICVIDKTRIDTITIATKNYWKRNLCDGQTDLTIHLALVENKEVGEKLVGSKFTSYCILKPNKSVSYYTWEIK